MSRPAAAHADLSANDPETLGRRGAVLQQQGRLAEAEACYRQAVALRPGPGHARLCADLGVVLCLLGRLDEACTWLERAVGLEPTLAGAHHNLGNALFNLGRLDEAAASYRAAVAHQPGFADAWNNLGLVLLKRRSLDEARDCFERAIALRPAYAEALCGMGEVREAQGCLDAARACFERALAADPGCRNGARLLALVRWSQGGLDEATALLEDLARREPCYVDALKNLGNAYVAGHRFAEAEACFARALALQDLPAIHVNLGLSRLLQGDLQRGWDEYEWRRRSGEHAIRRYRQPDWRGEPFPGRTLFVHREQGLGDMLQLARYLPAVAARGGRVLLECEDALRPLLDGFPGVDALVPADRQPPPFDLQLPLMSLPRVMGTRLDTIPPPAAGLNVPEATRRRWADRIGGGGALRVGLCWQGNPGHAGDRHRSLRLDLLEPLTRIPGVRLFHLGKGLGQQQLAASPLRARIADLSAGFADFTDTAAAVLALDLVISVDTAVVHLAATLGVPTWVLLSSWPDWRWLAEGETSPWYPTARLFRQQRFDAWGPVIERMAAELAATR